jgi:RNA polymerase sigma factor (sigma-70 family)
VSSVESFGSRLAAAREGADWAWREIYGELAPLVLGYLRARGAPDPDDLAGEAFAQVVRDLHRFEGGERAFRAWVMTVVHNRMLDELRRRGRRPVELLADPIGDEPGGDVETEALARLGASEVTAVLSELSPEQQSVLLLRILGDLTIEEVARVIGKRPGAVKQLQRRGLAAARRALARKGVTL